MTRAVPWLVALVVGACSAGTAPVAPERGPDDPSEPPMCGGALPPPLDTDRAPVMVASTCGTLTTVPLPDGAPHQMRADASGRIHLVTWHDREYGYTRSESGGWTVRTILATDSTRVVALALGPGGEPHALSAPWDPPHWLRWAHEAPDGDWASEDVPLEALGIPFVSAFGFDVDADDHPHGLMIDDSEGGVISLARDADGWTTAPAFEGNCFLGGPSLTVDDAGFEHVACYAPRWRETGGLAAVFGYGTNRSGEWSSCELPEQTPTGIGEGVGIGPDGGVAAWPAIAVDAAGTAHVAYQVVDGLVLAHLGSGGLTREFVPVPAELTHSPALAVELPDIIHAVAPTSGGGPEVLWYGRYQAGTWTTWETEFAGPSESYYYASTIELGSTCCGAAAPVVLYWNGEEEGTAHLLRLTCP